MSRPVTSPATDPSPPTSPAAWPPIETGTWHRLVTDELGHLIDYGQTVYRPPQDLQDFVNNS